MPDHALPRRVLKFGGSSLAESSRIAAVADIIAKSREQDPIAVVVSAWGGVTDALLEAAGRAADGDDQSVKICNTLEARHREAVDDLLDGEEQETLEELIQEEFGQLRDLLHGVSLVGECSPRSQDRIVCLGERLSAHILAAVLRRRSVDAEACDARELIVTDANFTAALVDTDASYRRIHAHLGGASSLQVIPGFTGATRDGATTTLGRGGSDLTAALVGAAVHCQAIELWTDVDGVMSADPRMVADAFPLRHLKYEELMELSHFGARVVYPPSVHPARQAGIPLLIKNTLRRDAEGTWIGADGGDDPHPIRGISSIHRVALMQLEGDGMVGVPGIAARLFGALARRKISVILIGQASSEHSICFAVLPDAVATAREEIQHEFELERRAGLIEDLRVEQGLSIIAVVGGQMRDRPGIAGRIFSVLGHRKVNIRAIAQGSSELNISMVVSADDEKTALGAIHDEFFRGGTNACHVFVAGTGRVGRELLHLFKTHMSEQLPVGGRPLRLAGVTNSRRMRIDPSGLERFAGENGSLLEGNAVRDARLADFVDEAIGQPGSRVFVDCTASDLVPEIYDRLLAAGVSVVTANKRRFAGSLDDFHALRAVDPLAAGVYFETTVGAALPIIGTLQNLILTGDRIQRIEGLLSGTIGYVLHRLDQGEKFSEGLRKAYERGYTEPDPREDLSGRDVARKILILARLAGFELEPDDVKVEPVVPESMLSSGTLDHFWTRLERADEAFAKQMAMSRSRSESLCYLARLEYGEATVRLTQVPDHHPCAGARSTDSLVAFYTDRYDATPLVVRGPGAGPAVTAAGVYADILRAAAEHHVS